MPPGCSRNQSVDRRNDLSYVLCGGRQLSPNLACFQIDGQNVIRVVALEGFQPAPKSPFVLALLQKRNPFDDLAHRKRADEQIVAAQRFDSSAYPRIAIR